MERETKNRMRKGQALVEFALALPLVLLLVLGVLEFGRAFQTKIVLTNAAREGTHYFMYKKDDAKTGFTDTETAVLAEWVNSGVSFDNTRDDIDILCFTDTDGDGQVDGTDSDGDGFVDSNDEVVAANVGAADPNAICPTGSTIVVITEKWFDLAVIGTFVDPFPIHSDARMLIP